MNYRISADGKIYVTPTTVCPECHQLMISQTDLMFLPDGKIDKTSVYEFDFAEEMQALPFVCANCGYKSGITGMDVRHEGGKAVEYR